MRVDEVVRSAIDRAGVIRVRNAMNPMLWLSSASAIIFLCAAFVFRDDPVLKYGFALLGASPILASLAAYFIFMFRDPDRLQSEEFVLKERALQLKYRQEEKAEIVDASRKTARRETLPRGFSDGDGR